MDVQRVVNDVMSSATYIISQDGFDEVWLIDCGTIEGIQAYIINKKVSGVLLTHTHYDHLNGLQAVISLFPDCRVFTNKAGVIGLSSTTLNLSKFFSDPVIIHDDIIEVVQEGDTIELFPGINANVLETPGHNPSCLCFEILDYLFTGDAYIPGYKTVTNFPGGDKELAQRSFIRIQTIADNHIVFPGHA